MVNNWHRRTLILGLSLSVAFLMRAGAFGAIYQKNVQKRNVQISAGFDKKTDATRERLVSEIKRELAAHAISASEQEVHSTAGRALDLIGKSKDPEKGVIYVHTKRFTFCSSWGRDKDFCKK